MSNIKSVTVSRETNKDGSTYITVELEFINSHKKKVRGIEAIELLNQGIAVILRKLFNCPSTK